MSWWISLHDPETGDVCTVDNHSEGGTYVWGGTNEAGLNVTYNYSKLIYQACEAAGYENTGMRDFNERKAKDVAVILEGAIAKLETAPQDGHNLDGAKDAHWNNEWNRGSVGTYWEATVANVTQCLKTLLAWSKQHPEAIWQVS